MKPGRIFDGGVLPTAAQTVLLALGALLALCQGPTGLANPTGPATATDAPIEGRRDMSWSAGREIATPVGWHGANAVLWVKGALDLVVSRDGRVHLLTVSDAAGTGSATGWLGIRHRLILEQEERDLEGISAQGEPLHYFTATEGSEGVVHAAWLQRPGDGTLSKTSGLYFASYREGTWGPTERVTDERARVGMWGDNVSLAALGDGRIDLFWTDWRERHLLRALLEDEAAFAKTFHRRRVGKEWMKAERMQKTGPYWAELPSAVPGPDGTVHLFWAKQLGPAEIRHTHTKNDGSSSEETLARSTNYDGTPGMILALGAAKGADDSLLVGWIHARWSTASQRERVLEYCALRNGAWSPAVCVSRTADDFKWVSGFDGAEGLLYQESDGADRVFDDQRGRRLVWKPVGPPAREERVRLSENGIVHVFDGETGPGPTIHVVYAEEAEDGRVRLVHRRSGSESSQPRVMTDGAR